MNQPIALITGSSRGLGREAALNLAARGTDVIVTYRSDRKAADQTVARIRDQGRLATALPLDVGDSAAFADFASRVGTVLREQWQCEQFDYLVNNAGVGIYAPLAETTEAQFDELMRIHLKGPLFLTQALLPLLRDGGRILNVSSGLTRFSLPNFGAYAMMKGGIEVMTRYLAKELGPRGIAVNTIAPGAIETDFHGGAVRDDKAMNDFVASVTALGRAGKPEDIGGLIAALLAPESRWVNAQRIEASGGMFL